MSEDIKEDWEISDFDGGDGVRLALGDRFLVVCTTEQLEELYAAIAKYLRFD